MIRQRTVEEVKPGFWEVTESTGERHHYSSEKVPPIGYRLFQYVVYPILTQEDIDSTYLPYFNVDEYKEYPSENSRIFQIFYFPSPSMWSIAERVARVRIAKNLGLLD